MEREKEQGGRRRGDMGAPEVNVAAGGAAQSPFCSFYTDY